MILRRLFLHCFHCCCYLVHLLLTTPQIHTESFITIDNWVFDKTLYILRLFFFAPFILLGMLHHFRNILLTMDFFCLPNTVEHFIRISIERERVACFEPLLSIFVQFISIDRGTKLYRTRHNMKHHSLKLKCKVCARAVSVCVCVYPNTINTK